MKQIRNHILFWNRRSHRDSKSWNCELKFSLFDALSGKAEEELEELAESLQLPSEVLTLREGSEPSPEVTAYTKVMLQGGTLFGPYPARLVNEPSVNANHVTVRHEPIRSFRFFLRAYNVKVPVNSEKVSFPAGCSEGRGADVKCCSFQECSLVSE